MKTYLAAATIALTTLGTAASAATLTADTTLGLAPGVPAGQDFVADLQAAGVTDLYSGNTSIMIDREVRVTFTLVGAESTFDNTLIFDGTDIIKEGIDSAEVAAPDMLTGTLAGGFGMDSYVTNFLGGDLASLLSFQINTAGPSFSAVDDEFGVFVDSSTVGNLSTFFLALDDNGNDIDDNHDDIIVRVDLTAVPIPASGLLLLAGMGGLAAMRRRQKA